MKNPLAPDLDWDDLRVLLAAARAGSLSGAAPVLGMSIATVGRRLERIEARIGRRVLHRSAQGLRVAPEGELLIDAAERVAEAVTAFERVAAGSVSGAVGSVTVSTLETIATHLLAPTLAEFRLSHPRIELTIRSEARLVSLAERIADIALRVVRPTEERVVTRRVARIHMALCASPAYLARRGTPEHPDADLSGHELVTYLTHMEALPEAAWLSTRARATIPAVRLSTLAAIEVAVRHGAGLGVLPRFLVGEGLVSVFDGESLPVRDVWLVVHEDLKDAPHVRAVADHLAAVMGAAVGDR